MIERQAERAMHKCAVATVILRPCGMRGVLVKIL
jgi:hypothetical protein